MRLDKNGDERVITLEGADDIVGMKRCLTGEQTSSMMDAMHWQEMAEKLVRFMEDNFRSMFKTYFYLEKL